MLSAIQNDLFDLGADLCTPEADEYKWEPLRVTDAQVERLEQEIDRMNAELEPLNSFILPGGGARRGASASGAHGRAPGGAADDGELAETQSINPAAMKYINRLSDHLFVMARWLNDKGRSDVLWVPGANR